MANESYREIPDSEMVAGAPVTASLVLRLRDNIAGISAGLAINDYPIQDAAFTNLSLFGSTVFEPGTVDGNAKIQNGAVDSLQIFLNSCSIDKLATGLDEVSVIATAGTANLVYLTATNYYYMLGYKSWSDGPQFPRYQMGFEAGETVLNTNTNWLTNSSASLVVWVHEVSAITGATVTVGIQYVTASPPYDLEEGGPEIPLFLYAIQAPGGGLKQIYSTNDPPWAHGGPTAINGNVKRDGKLFHRRRIRPAVADLVDPRKRDKALDLLRSNQFEEYEITPAVKRADMDRCPHPFGNIEAGDRPILIDPSSPIMAELAALRDGGESLPRLLLDGYLRLGDDLERPPGPAGVAQPGIKWA